MSTLITDGTGFVGEKGFGGRHADDPAVNYKGNYGNLLFFWDVLFGTARITRSYPQSYGVENLAPATLGQQLLWPIFPENKSIPEDITVEAGTVATVV